MNSVKSETVWSMEDFKQAIKDHQKDMKCHGMPKYTMTEAKRDIIMMMRDNNISIKN